MEDKQTEIAEKLAEISTKLTVSCGDYARAVEAVA